VEVVGETSAALLVDRHTATNLLPVFLLHARHKVRAAGLHPLVVEDDYRIVRLLRRLEPLRGRRALCANFAEPGFDLEVSRAAHLLGFGASQRQEVIDGFIRRVRAAAVQDIGALLLLPPGCGGLSTGKTPHGSHQTVHERSLLGGPAASSTTVVRPLTHEKRDARTKANPRK
jgi:hypothetical protein